MAREGLPKSRGGHERERLNPGVKGPRPDNKKHRVEEAKERQETWAKLGPKGQLAALDARLGKGVGATAQRARLQNLIDNPPKPKRATKAEESPAPEQGTGERLKAKDRKAAERSKRPGAEAKKA
jgi:hypothetical protein